MPVKTPTTSSTKIFKDGKMVIAYEPKHDEGCTSRDHKYRERLIESVKHSEIGKTVPEHPLFHGIVMSAHHLISIQGFNKSKLNPEDIEYKGYNINYPKNLIFLPYETAGACHLGVQLHRGDHRVIDTAGRNYHGLVAFKLNREQNSIAKCGKKSDLTLASLIDLMDEISDSMVDDIKFIADGFPAIYLSSVSANFINTSSVGCANGLNISEIKDNMLVNKKRNCINRDHQYSVSKRKTKRGYKITYPKQNYELKAGL